MSNTRELARKSQNPFGMRPNLWRTKEINPQEYYSE